MGGGARCMAVEVTNDVIECENAASRRGKVGQRGCSSCSTLLIYLVHGDIIMVSSVQMHTLVV